MAVSQKLLIGGDIWRITLNITYSFSIAVCAVLMYSVLWQPLHPHVYMTMRVANSTFHDESYSSVVTRNEGVNGT